MVKLGSFTIFKIKLTWNGFYKKENMHHIFRYSDLTSLTCKYEFLRYLTVCSQSYSLFTAIGDEMC